MPERVEGQTDEEYRRAKWHASLRWRNGRMQDHKPLVEQHRMNLLKGHPDVNVAGLVLMRNADLQAEHHTELLSGVTILQGKALAEGNRTITLTAVPYYAWANKERGWMAVWLNEEPAPGTAGVPTPPGADI